MSDTRWGRLSGWLVPLAGYAAVALAWVADVLRSPTTLLHGHTDAFNYVWRIWWLAEGHRVWNSPALSSNAVFYPLGHRLPEGELAPLQVLPAVLLSKAMGVIAAYNVVVYASFVLAGIATYAFCRALAVSRPASFIGGLVFAFAAYPTVQAQSHLPLIGTWTLPFGLLWIEKTISAENERTRSWSGAIVGLAAGLAAWSSWYYAVIFGLALLLYALLRARGTAWRRLVIPAATAMVVAAAMVAPLYALVRAFTDPGQMTWSLDTYAGASPLAFLMPSYVQGAAGSFFTMLWDPRSGENSLHLGWIPLLLALGALATGLARSRRAGRDPEADADARTAGSVRALAVLGGAFALLSLGPFLYLHGEKAFLAGVPVAWPFGRQLAEAVRTHGLPLPGLLLTDAPVVRSMREFTRFGVVVLASTAALAALGTDALARTVLSRRRALVLALLASLVAIEFFPGPASSAAVPTEVHRWIASRPGGGSIVHLPHRIHTDQTMLDTVWTGKPLAEGDTTFVDEQYMFASRRMWTYPSEQALRVLDERSVRWIVWDVAEGGPPPEVPGRFAVAARFGSVVVLERLGPPLQTPTGVAQDRL